MAKRTSFCGEEMEALVQKINNPHKWFNEKPGERLLLTIQTMTHEYGPKNRIQKEEIHVQTFSRSYTGSQIDKSQKVC